jgi:hypothetical protein
LESSEVVEPYLGGADLRTLNYLTISQISKRRHRYSKRLPMFYFDSQFNVPVEQENELSPGLTYRSYPHMVDCGFESKYFDYLNKLSLVAESYASTLIKKSYRSPYLAIANGPEISPHVHLYTDSLDAQTNLKTLSVCINQNSENASFQFYLRETYINEKIFKDRYHNSILPIAKFPEKPLYEYKIQKDITLFTMESSQTVHAVTEFNKGSCLFFIYDKIELLD